MIRSKEDYGGVDHICERGREIENESYLYKHLNIQIYKKLIQY